MTVTLPQEATGQPKAWLLRDGLLPAQDGQTLKVGLLAPFSTMVLE